MLFKEAGDEVMVGTVNQDRLSLSEIFRQFGGEDGSQLIRPKPGFFRPGKAGNKNVLRLHELDQFCSVDDETGVDMGSGNSLLLQCLGVIATGEGQADIRHPGNSSGDPSEGNAVGDVNGAAEEKPQPLR